MGLSKNQIVLLCSTPLLCGTMIYLVPALTITFGKTIGYIAAFCVYWFVFCIPISLYVSGGVNGLKSIYSMKSDVTTVTKFIHYFIAFIPCIAIFFVAFIKVAPQTTIQILFVSLFCALINGTIEELFWRGVFNKIFKDKIFFAYIFPAIFFGVWHIGLFLARGINYQGGFIALVGGATFMGWLWGWIAYKTKSIKITTTAHIISNFLAFTTLIYENWYI
ncbi:MAG: hypothetical protein CVU84_01725 [Firmicutes bacterium HGW-Firmicutes-1]|jgi:hypothetical protein|nr:MAG: hypothetical protein CVU84_01725 [Firmicutes bacterium HGW-Firmicutes-1]